jgi:hypothetical protein
MRGGLGGLVLGRGFLMLLVAMTTVASLGVSSAQAAAPQVKATWTTGVKTTAAGLRAVINPGGLATTYRFEYIPAGAFGANHAAGRDGYFGASRIPAPDATAGSGIADSPVAREPLDLAGETQYRYRAVAKNADGTTFGPERILTTRGLGGPLSLLDNRGWEMVSPVDKNGGEVQGFGGNAGGGALQAAAQGEAMSFSSASAFGAGGQGAPVASQYVSRRTPWGWAVENITAPLLAGAYEEEPNGVPYRLFSADLGRALMEGTSYPPLLGSGAPAGYANYYLRSAFGGFTALLTHPDIAELLLAPEQLELDFAGASPDLGHVVLSTCAALTADATEVPGGGGGCDPVSQNLYQWSGAGLRLLNLLPGATTGTPPGQLAAPSGAISNDGTRVYWTDGTDLYLREGSRTVPVDGPTGGGAFQLATPDGAHAFFVRGEHLFRFDVASEASVDLTPAGGVKGVLGASADGLRVYFATATAIFLAQGITLGEVAAAPDAVNYPPSTGTARVTADGTRLAFVSAATGLTPYDNADAGGAPKSHAQIYLFDATANSLVCASCIPTGERPSGPASIPGAVANGQGEGATRMYKPRALSADGRRLFFDSPDALVLQDSNSERDVYEWEAGGTGSCAKPQGCLQLISSGRASGGGTFLDASASGSDVFFLTDGSLVRSDPGAFDVYDARENGGFPEPPTPFPCEEDACQPLPSPPIDPSPGTLFPNTGNPPVHFPKAKKPKGKSKKAKGGKKKTGKRKGKQAKGKQRRGGRR